MAQEELMSYADRGFLILLSNKLNETYSDEYRRNYYLVIAGILKVLQSDAREVGLNITLEQAYIVFIRHPSIVSRFHTFFVDADLFHHTH